MTLHYIKKESGKKELLKDLFVPLLLSPLVLFSVIQLVLFENS